MKGYLDGADKEIRNARKAIDALYENKTMDPDQKRAALNRVWTQMVNVAREALAKKPIPLPLEAKSGKAK